MSKPRTLLVLLGAVAALSTVQLSGATFTSASTSQGSVTASPDWTPPTVSVNDSPSLVRGTTTLTTTAADAHSAVQSVRIEVRAAGSAAAWTALCTATVAPYSCSWVTTQFADGVYDVRAIATDVHANSATSAVVQRTVDNLGPVVAIDEDALPAYARGTITVVANASDAGGVASVRIQRSANGTGSWTDLCTDSTAPYSCSLTTSSNTDVFLRAIATDISGNSTISAVVEQSVDNITPSVSMGNQGSLLSGTVTLSASASDADSGVASVLIQYRSSSTAPWVNVCTDTTSPYSCRWDTTQVPNGTTYAFRATATDEAGNVAVTGATTTSTVDNSVASVSMEDPGQYLRGTVALNANATAPGGVASVTIQHARAGTTTWTTVCVDTTSPYSCDWDTTQVADGSYDLRAVMTPVTGSAHISNVVQARIVDNAPLRGYDVQAANGGSLGRIDAGDTVSFTYDTQVNLETLVAGWTGESRTVALRLRDGAVTGGLNSQDTLDVFTSTALSTPVNLGVLNTRGNYLKGSTPLLFNATMTAETVTVNGQPATRVVVRITGVNGTDSGRVEKNARTMAWTPSAAARDLAGNAAATTPVEELGALDRDF